MTSPPIQVMDQKGRGKKERINPKTNPMILGVKYLKAVHGSRLIRSLYVEHLIVVSVPMPRRARGAAEVSMCVGSALSRQHAPHAHIHDYPVKSQIMHQGSSCIPSLRFNLLRSSNLAAIHQNPKFFRIRPCHLQIQLQALFL